MSSDQGPEIVRYLRAFEIANHKLLEPKLTISRLGWLKARTGCVFIPYSDEAILVPKGSGDSKMASPETFAQHGSAQEWLKLFEVLADYPVALFLLIAELTPPLLPALGEDAQSHMVAICGEKGSGKRVMQQIGASAYGNPQALVRSWDATSVGVEQALALRTHLPANYEDLQHASDRDVNDLVFKVFNQVGRERGAREGGTRATAQFQTIMVASAEMDISEKAHFAGF